MENEMGTGFIWWLIGMMVTKIWGPVWVFPEQGLLVNWGPYWESLVLLGKHHLWADYWLFHVLRTDMK